MAKIVQFWWQIVLLAMLSGRELLVSGHEQISGGLTFELQDNDRFCFYERFHNATVYIFNYQVLKGGNLDIDVEVESPRGKVMYSEARRQSDTVPLDVSAGTFMFCFGNEFSSVTHKIVHFSLKPTHEDIIGLAREVNASAIRPGVNTMMDQTMENIHGHGNKIMEFQSKYRQNEARGRYAAESLNYRVMWWSVGQSLVIVGTGLGQIFFLRRFFTDRRNARSHATEADGNCVQTGRLAVRP